MSTILRLVFSLLLISILTQCGSQNTGQAIDRSNYIVKFGVFEPDSYTLHEETTTIPMKFSNTGFSCGYIIYAKDKKDFLEYSITYPPNPTIAGKTITKASKKDTGLRGPTAKSTQGSVAQKFGFDKGDPHGVWSTDLYINGQHLTSISFEVTPPQIDRFY